MITTPGRCVRARRGGPTQAAARPRPLGPEVQEERPAARPEAVDWRPRTRGPALVRSHGPARADPTASRPPVRVPAPTPRVGARRRPQLGRSGHPSSISLPSQPEADDPRRLRIPVIGPVVDDDKPAPPSAPIGFARISTPAGMLIEHSVRDLVVGHAVALRAIRRVRADHNAMRPGGRCHRRAPATDLKPPPAPRAARPRRARPRTTRTPATPGSRRPAA